MRKKWNELDEFTRSYIMTALWSSMDNSDENTGGEPLDSNYDYEDISDDTLEYMLWDCDAFQKDNWELIVQGVGGIEENGEPYSSIERAGHDFWLTRNHHGAGFWDGDWPESIGEQLTKAANKYGECDLYVGDDRKIYVY